MSEIDELLAQYDNITAVSQKEEKQDVINETSNQTEKAIEIPDKKVYLTFSSETLEKMVVGYFYQDRSTFLKLAQYLTTKNWEKDSFFTNKKLQFIVNTCFEYSEKYKKMPSEEVIFSEIETKINDVFTQEGVKKLFNELQTIDYSKFSEDYIKDVTVNFIKNERAIEAAALCQKEISKGNYSNLSKIMSDAVNVNLDKDLGVSIKNIPLTFGMIKETQNSFSGCTWGSPSLDNKFGRIQNGEIAFVAGVPGAGKTTWLQHFAVDNFAENKKIALFSFEVNTKRLSARIYKNIFEVGTKDLLDMDEQEAFKKINQCNGDIRIFAKTANTVSSEDMAAILMDLKTYEDWTPDLIIVDYVMITSTNDKTKDSSDTYKYYKTVAEELRNLAVIMNCPVISAVQLNRDAMGDSGGSKAVVSSKNISESRGVLDTADYVLIIEQTAEEKYTNKEHTEGLYRIKTDKNRNGESNDTIYFKINWEKMSISEVRAEVGIKMQELGKKLAKEEKRS